jgi:hypothetical protein
MSRRDQRRTEAEIDDIVVSQADEDTAWDAPVQVEAAVSSFSLPADLSMRASFLARLHHARGLEDWLARVIRERIELEESAFAAAKRDLARMPSK